MHSKLLEKHGLKNFVAGTDFNFRSKTAVNMSQDLERALEILGADPEEIYSGKQCHGKTVQYVDETSGEDFIFGKQYKDTDGLITDKKDVALLIKFADCTPIVLFDPTTGVHASVHSGWRGTVQKISKQAIDKMVEEFGSKKENILAYVGPSIDIDNYEVGTEVYEAFEDFDQRDSFFKEHGEKYLLSMSDANLSILLEEGIKEENIEVSRESTFTSDLLHSSRQEGADYQLNSIITVLEK